MEDPVVIVSHFSAWFGEHQVLQNISLSFRRNRVTAIMGPSGCGKTTLIRCLNRMHELTPGSRHEGEIVLNEKSIYAVDPIMVRRRIGMVFQRPNPFPTMSIFRNVIAGYHLNGIRLRKSEQESIVEKSLQRVALWDEVKDSLHRTGTFLSGGQQQRLCIARCLAMDPDVLLLDEPTSALDPKSTAAIEELIQDLEKTVTIIIVTHNIAQARRVSDYTAFLYLGDLVEYDSSEKMFTVPKDKRTEEYLTGKFG